MSILTQTVVVPDRGSKTPQVRIGPHIVPLGVKAGTLSGGRLKAKAVFAISEIFSISHVAQCLRFG